MPVRKMIPHRIGKRAKVDIFGKLTIFRPSNFTLPYSRRSVSMADNLPLQVTL